MSFAAPNSSPRGSNDDGCYILRLSGKAWQITGELRSQLLATGAWQLAKREEQPSHLLLADRGRVNWAREVVARRPPSVPKRFERFMQRQSPSNLCMVNTYRGCNELSNKSALVKTMRQYAAERGLTAAAFEWLPQTFVLRPGDSNDERQLFIEEFRRQQQLIAAESSSATATPVPATRNAWIVKANRGAKGDSIFVSDDAEKLIAYVDARSQFTQHCTPIA